MIISVSILYWNHYQSIKLNIIQIIYSEQTLWRGDSQNVVPEQAASTWSGNLLEMQSLKSCPGPSEWETLRVSPEMCVLICPPGETNAWSILTTNTREDPIIALTSMPTAGPIRAILNTVCLYQNLYVSIFHYTCFIPYTLLFPCGFPLLANIDVILL